MPSILRALSCGAGARWRRPEPPCAARREARTRRAPPPLRCAQREHWAEGATVWDFVLRMNVTEGPFLITVYALAAAVFIYLLGRGPWWGWILTAIVVLIVGALVGAGVLWTAVNVLDSF